MVFDIDKILEERDTVVMYLVIAGPEMTFAGLTMYQRNMFARQINDMMPNDIDIAHDMKQSVIDMEELYKNHVHKTCIATPRYIVLVDRSGVIYSSVIGDIGVMLLNINKHHTLHVWAGDTESDFVRACRKYNRWSGQVQFDVPMIHTISDEYGYLTLEEELAYIGCLDTGELITEPHRMLVEQTERLQLAAESKALALYKLQC